MGGLISFLGGSVFRLIWSQIAEYVNKRQDHEQELAKMQLQQELDKSRHIHDCERIKLQSELGVKEILVAAGAEVDKKEADAFIEAMKNAAAPTGIWWVDAWNGVIRPMGATLGYALMLFELWQLHWVMNDWYRDLIGVMLGFFFASRELGKGRK